METNDDRLEWTTAMRAVADGTVGADENPLPEGMTFFSYPYWMEFMMDDCNKEQLGRVADWMLERYSMADLLLQRDKWMYLRWHCHLFGTEAATAFLLDHLRPSDPIEYLTFLRVDVLTNIVRAIPGEYPSLVTCALRHNNVPLLTLLLDTGNTISVDQMNLRPFNDHWTQEMQDFLRLRGYL